MSDGGSIDPLDLAHDAFAILSEIKDYALYLLDPSGRILTWNSGAQAIKGYTADEIIGQNFSLFFSSQDRAGGRPQRLLGRAASAGRTQDEGWRIRKDGSSFWADAVLTAVHGRDGQLRGFIKVTRDLTERRRAVELLRESEERSRLLIESVKDYAIFMLDADGVVATWNAGAERIKGYRADEIIGKHLSIFYPPEAVAARHPEHELEVARAEGRYEEEGWRVRKDGQRFWANVVLTAIHDPVTGALRGFAKVTRDLTERRRMEEEARAAAAQAALERIRTEQARTQLHARDEFIAVAAHELRTPLTALLIKLQGAADLLRKAGDVSDSASQARLAGRLDTALHQIQRLTELVERLLDVSRIVTGTLEVTLDEVDLAAIVRRVVDDLSEAARAGGSEVRLNASGEARGLWDGTRIEQVVTNLVSNAIKYGGGKPIDVELRATAESATIVVQDRGIGIAADAIDRIFTRFERAAPVRNYGGLGLGLYVARNIVDAHGGSIRVSSEPGQGSTFIVELPRRRADARPGARAETQP